MFLEKKGYNSEHRILDKKTYKSTTISWGDNGSRGSVGTDVSILDEKYVRFHYTQTDNVTGEKKDFSSKIETSVPTLPRDPLSPQEIVVLL